MTIQITEYDPSWPTAATEACTELTDALPELFTRIEHVGSTSVPGLAAKPVIDLMAAVTALDDVTTERHDTLQHLGFRLQDTGMPGRLFYYREDDDGRRTHHLHIVPADTWDTRNERLLRDHLLANPEAAEAYGALKWRLAEEGHEGLEYTKRKTELIQGFVDRERAARGLPSVPVWEE